VINFRYHVVSLTAVFLALTIGLVLGTTALNGAIADQLKDRVSTLSQQNQEYRDRVTHLENDVNSQEDFAVQAAPMLLADRLAGRRVLVMSVPSGTDYVDGVVQMLATAGATVTGQVRVTDKFIDPNGNDALLDLAHVSLLPSITGNLPTNTDGVEASAALLAAVLLDRTPAVTGPDRTTVLAAYQSQEYLTVAAKVTGPAEVTVLVSGAPVTEHDAARRNAAVITLSDQLDQAGHVVVAANTTAGDGNVVAVLRADPQLSKHIATVDNVSTPQGRIAAAFAVAEQLAGRVGWFGIGDGATLLPSPSP
jgi:outer membrane murein-binding lipoprotein Lpp